MASACLSGVKVLCAAPTDAEEEELRRQVRSLGGMPLCMQDLINDVQPSCLVATSVLTSAYKVSEHGHALKAFQGITVSISKMLPKEKARFSELIRQHGGAYSPELTKLCTHLVVMNRPGKPRVMSDKEMHSRIWGNVHIVWDSWLVTNTEAGFYKADESAHVVPDVNGAVAQPPPRLPQGNIVNARDTGGANETSAGTLPTIGTRVVPQGDAGGLSSQAHSQASGREDPSGARGASEGGGAHAESRPQQPREPLRESRDCSPVSSPAPAAGPTPRSGSGGCQRCGGSSGSNDDDTLFLSGQLVHLACCHPPEQLEGMRILREGGCTRRPDLRNDVTHVVVGSDLTAAEVKAIAEHVQRHGHTSRVVSMQWLRACLEAREAVPVDDSLALKPADLNGLLLRSQQDAREAREAAVAAASKLRSTQGPSDSTSRQAGDRFLEGYFFTLSALPAKGKDEEFARKAIQQAGARLFDHRTMALVTAKDRAFAVCPPSMLREESLALSKNCPDFRLVPEKNWVTPRWLDASLDLRRPLLPIPYDRVECQPVPYTLPIKGMSDVAITASNLSQQEKDSVKGLVKLLGGQYTVKMGFRNTHLVVPFAAGDKYQGAVRFEVRPVTYKWLVDVAKTGKLLPESSYHPPAMEEGENPDQSQFPFEATAAPPQDSARASQAAGTQGRGGSSLFRQVMAPSNTNSNGSQRGAAASQPWKPAPRAAKPLAGRSTQGGAEKASQGGGLSRLDSLFDSLKSPAKATPPPSAGGRKSGAGSVETPPAMAARDESDNAPQDPAEAGRDAQSPRAAVGDALQGSQDNRDAPADSPGSPPLAVVGGMGPGMAVGSAEDPFFLEHLDRINDALGKNVPQEPSQSSQQELMMPPPRARLPTSSNASDDPTGSRGPSPSDARARRRGTRRANSGASEDSHAGRKRARSSSRQVSSKPPLGDMDASQYCSQQVGYEGVSKSGMAFPIESRQASLGSGSGSARSTRMGKSGASSGIDKDLARQQLAKAATRRGGAKAAMAP